MTTPRKIAVLGTGVIGAPVAANLGRVFEVRAWNRTRARADAVAGDGVTVHDTVAEAVAGADVVVTVLTDGPAVLEVMRAAAPELAPGTVWLQLSTVGTEAADDLARFADEHSLVLYDAPVLGTRKPAEDGALVVLAAGAPEHRAGAQAVFDVIGGRTLWVADEPGAASRLKLALNSLVFAITHGTAESLALAAALDVDPHLVLDAVAGGPLDSGYVRTKGAMMLAGDYTTSFSVANSLKDARLVAEAAEQAGVAVDVAQAGLARFRRAVELGHGDKDMAASYLAR